MDGVVAQSACQEQGLVLVVCKGREITQQLDGVDEGSFFLTAAGVSPNLSSPSSSMLRGVHRLISVWTGLRWLASLPRHWARGVEAECLVTPVW